MTQQITIFGQEVSLETMRVAIVAIGHGFTVTVEAILDGDDVLCAHTVARASATVEEATSQMVPEAAAAVRQWITDHTDGVER
ncbi:hypothetical protein [Microbacterium arborescens]